MSYIYKPARGRPLTAKEAEVFDLLLAGHSQKGIARIVGCAQETIKTHVFRVRHKLGAKNNEQAAALFTLQKVKEEI